MRSLALPRTGKIRKNRENVYIFLDFFGPWRKWHGMAPNGAGRIFFQLIQALPTFWAERISILRTFTFSIFWIPNFWISRSPDFQNLALGRAWALGRPWAGRGPRARLSSDAYGHVQEPLSWDTSH